MKTRLVDFDFELVGYGRYNVTYSSPKTGKRWNKLITDMEVIDATKNTECPKHKDLDLLKRMVKSE